MAKSENQKLKMIYLMDKFLRDTDEEHGITVKEMIEYLDKNDIGAERKSLYDDIARLQDYGLDIISEKIGRETYYKLVSREFELAELKLLVDSVQSSKFITTAKTNDLIKKLENLTSRYQAGSLQRQVYVINRVKNPNEKIYHFVDALHEAIHNRTMINFQYGVWNTRKQLVPKHGEDKTYTISPWALSWYEENYYLIGYDHDEEKDKHFRVDKLLKLDVCKKSLDYVPKPTDMDIASYTSKIFGMFGGEPVSVKLKVENSMVGVVLDRFGKNINLIPVEDEDRFTVNVDVAMSQQFIGWLVGLGDKVQVVAPDELRQKVKESLEEILELYKKRTS